MSYNGSGTFVVNSSGQPVVTGTVISSTAFNALTADLATGLSTAITKDGQTTTTARILFAQGISSTLTTDATSTTTGSIITAGGISTQKALWVGTTSNFAGAMTGTTLALTKASAGDALTWTNGGSTPKTGYLYSDSNVIAMFNVAGAGAGRNGIQISSTAVTVDINAGTATAEFTANGSSSALTISGRQTNVLVGNNGTGNYNFMSMNGSIVDGYHIGLVGGATADPSVYLDSGYVSSTPGNVVFRIGGASAHAEVARFDSSGNLLVNRTTSINGNAKFQVTGNDVNYTSIINDGTATNGCQLIRFASNTGGIGTVTNAANVAVAYNTTSDKNLKTLVGTRENGDLFDLVEWNEFTWNKAPQIGVQVGVFAQDIQKLIPNVVAEGRGVLGDEDYEPWQVNYTGLVPYLGAEVKSLRARVATLEARLTALENK